MNNLTNQPVLMLPCNPQAASAQACAEVLEHTTPGITLALIAGPRGWVLHASGPGGRVHTLFPASPRTATVRMVAKIVGDTGGDAA